MNRAQIGARFRSQVVVFDPAANGLGLTLTKGLASTVGGTL